jgi:hypothetical protein
MDTTYTTGHASNIALRLNWQWVPVKKEIYDK